MSGQVGAPSRRVAGRAWLAALALLAAPAPADAKSILVFGPHEDDEIFLGAGVARAALARGDAVKMVLVTNGDVNGVSAGLARQGNSVTAAQAIGLAEQDVIFLGYGDGLLATLYRSTVPTQVYASAAGQSATYGTRGLGGMDYHRYVHGTSGPYDRATLVGDVQDVIARFRPDEIYTVSAFDDHDDHQATALVILEAIVGLQRAGLELPVKLYQGMIWAPGAPWPWPQVEATGFTPWLPHYKPGCCVDTATPLDWQRLRHVPVPLEMQGSDPSTSLKWQSIQAGFGSYAWYASFARREEFFWETDLGANLATRAVVTASSQDAAGGRVRGNAVDGKLHGMSIGGVHEWATSGQLAGAWIQLDWPSAVRVSRVNLWDRPSLAENVLGGTLTFSDGSSVAVGALPARGNVLPVTFSPREVTWVRFSVTQAEGTAAGLAEIEVMGAPAGAGGNAPPHVLAGPGGASELTVAGGQALSLQVVAHDLDGDALSYAWSADAGTITGDGPTAVLRAPGTTTGATVEVSVTVRDGAGGTAANRAYVQVTPGSAEPDPISVSSLSLSPSSVTGGQGATGTVTLDAAAGSGGIAVQLTTSSAAATAPASVVVPAGSTSATFAVSTAPVAGSTPVTVTASGGSASRTATLTVNAPRASRLTLASSSLASGSATTGTVTLTGAAPAQGALVALSSSSTSAVTVPASVLVPAGATTATFPVTAALVTSTRSATVTATCGGASATASLSVQPITAASLSLSPTSVKGGSGSVATVWLSGPAPAGGIVVTLSSSNTSAATVPSSVTVPVGSSSATATVSTRTVTSTKKVSISARAGGVTRQATLQVTR